MASPWGAPGGPAPALGGDPGGDPGGGPGEGSRYPRAVLAALASRGLSPGGGLDVLYHGDIPEGAGLSSSASMEVVTGFALAALFVLPIAGPSLALACQEAENKWVGVKCGIMDQFASVMGRRGRALLLDCDSLQHSYHDLSLPGTSLIVTNSNKPHALAASKYNERFDECQAALAALRRELDAACLCQVGPEEFERHAGLIADPLLQRRARYVVNENRRTIEAAARLEKGDLEGMGRLMNASHASMRDDFEITSPEMDALASLAWSVKGVWGSRMTGGGFGGCTVSLVRQEAVEEFKRAVGEGSLAATGYRPSFYFPESSGGAAEIEIKSLDQPI
jgi:galactokinase